MLIIKALLFSFIVFCEAKNQPFNTMLAVAETIENRSLNPIEVLGKNQFCFNTGRHYADNLKVLHKVLAAGFLAANGLKLSGIEQQYYFHDKRMKKPAKDWGKVKFVGKSGSLKFYRKENNHGSTND